MTSESNIIPATKRAYKNLGRVLVLGLGKSGKAACGYCRALLGTRVSFLSIALDMPSEEDQAFVESLDSEGQVELFTNLAGHEERFDVCIASPGISQFSNLYKKAEELSTEVISEVEFAWRESDENSTWIGITGTNGKTTTTALLAHILAENALRASAVGNIGFSCLEAVAQGETDIYVAELSSFQLASTHYFAPRVAILLNITPDHIKWHTTFQEYVGAKKRIFAQLAHSADSFAVIDATGDECRAIVKELKNTLSEKGEFDYIPLGTAEGISGDMREACGAPNAAFLKEGKLEVGLKKNTYTISSMDEMQLKGEHNAENALAAACAALILGLDAKQIEGPLKAFEALEHRMEECGTIAGVRFVNDSKATNVEATRMALGSFGDKKPLVLLGGYDKGTDLNILVQEAQNKAKAVVCFGEAGTRFFEAFESTNLPRFLENSLEEAFLCALEKSEKGDIVLLSPACASFDEFSSFEQRGQYFKELVANKTQKQVD